MNKINEYLQEYLVSEQERYYKSKCLNIQKVISLWLGQDMQLKGVDLPRYNLDVKLYPAFRYQPNNNLKYLYVVVYSDNVKVRILKASQVTKSLTKKQVILIGECNLFTEYLELKLTNVLLPDRVKTLKAESKRLKRLPKK